MSEQPTIALLAARYGPLRDSLLALLQVLPGITRIHYLEDIDLGQALDLEVAPAVVLIDGDLITPERYAVVKLMKLRWPQAGFILFGNNVDQQREARNAGLGLVLLKGHPAPHLAILIKSLVAPEEGSYSYGEMHTSQH